MNIFADRGLCFSCHYTQVLFAGHYEATVGELVGSSLFYMPTDHIAKFELSLLDPIQTCLDLAAHRGALVMPSQQVLHLMMSIALRGRYPTLD